MPTSGTSLKATIFVLIHHVEAETLETAAQSVAVRCSIKGGPWEAEKSVPSATPQQFNHEDSGEYGPEL